MTLSVPIGYQAMKNEEVDVFLGNWMPAQQAFIDDLKKADAIEVLARNLEGAKFTLAVPSYVAKEESKISPTSRHMQLNSITKSTGSKSVLQAMPALRE
jgi:ABC-type proline/glycine betaine transport system substrate-binding protein